MVASLIVVRFVLDIYGLSPSVSHYIRDRTEKAAAYNYILPTNRISLLTKSFEKNTAAAIVQHLETFKVFTIHSSIGGHGVAASFSNGPGKTDLDGVEKPVMHACGHDMHITTLLAAAECLVKCRDEWSGELVLVFQPAEERAGGAQAMVDDGLYKLVKEPDVVVGAHVMPERAGVIGTKYGLIASSADRFQYVLIISTYSKTQARFILANLKIDVRAALPATRDRVLASVKRIIASEASASNNPITPVLTPTTQFPLLFNDAGVTAKLEEAFSKHFIPGKQGYQNDIARLQGSEDFGILATSIGRPSCFFLYGGIEEGVWDRAVEEGRVSEDVPGNHSPFFAPQVQPTLTVGMEGYVVSALALFG
ncbi:hippurate hydrolase [Pyrenophora seminiperda CCB06]|uniref:Hippurate hydrolase n=1 Tax=Pyrenophora seminiperda CCB06 TaxID=1302712 RepID=A0A3M7MB88_9PLEO|nr:hippurate hydrolase [Pyrenophora seminiperda CCB06]